MKRIPNLYEQHFFTLSEMYKSNTEFIWKLMNSGSNNCYEVPEELSYAQEINFVLTKIPHSSKETFRRILDET